MLTGFKSGGLKKEVLKAAIANYSKKVNQFSAHLHSAVDERNGPAFNPAKPPPIESLDEINLLSNQIETGRTEFEILRKMENYIDHLHTFVELGSLVITNRGMFFIAPEQERITVRGRTVAFIPVHSGLYRSMKGKREGDSFFDQGLQYEIKEIL